MLRKLIGLRWRHLIDVYARSAAATVATVAPLMLVYEFVAQPGAISFGWLALAAVAGSLCWLGALFLVRHPARHEVSGFVELLLQGRPLRRFRMAPAE
jgi:hypothetical protein